jgi:DNA-binding transcriptional regulator YdaS (Cro superfamily)
MTNGLKKAVAAMGGVSAFARALGVDRTAPYKWRRGVPAERVIEIESLTGVPREELRPDLYEKRLAATKRAR